MANSTAAEKRQAKLDRLVEIEGYDSLDDLLPAICMSDGCDYTAEMEPDQDRGWCEVCGTNTVTSALVLAGFI